MNADQLKQKIKDYFDLSSYLEDQQEAEQSILDGVSFRGPNIIILIIAIVIASLGLNTNSAAVIIGAMLISPLMGPIIGIGLGVGTYNYQLVKRSARNLAAAALFSVAASTIYFLISPVSEGHSELLARTSPTIYDVLIGFFGGGAGIVAIACKQKGNVIPGVAIATALMPPLCTAGYGLATMQLQYFGGALYLFVINSIFIAFATILGVKLFRFKQYSFVNEQRKKRVKNWITVIVVLTLLPSIYLTILMLKESYYIDDANQFIEQEFNLPNTQVFNKNVYMNRWDKYMDVTLIGRSVNIDSLQQALTAKMELSPELRGTHLKITQGFSTNEVDVNGDNGQSGLSGMFTTLMAENDRQRAQIDSLNSVIRHKSALDSLAYTIAPELRVLYPDISYISLQQMLICNTDDRMLDTLNIAIIEQRKPVKNTETLTKYLETRTGLQNLHIIDSRIPVK